MHALYTRINTGILVFIALTGVVLVTMMATQAYGGPLDPSSAPGSTLPQVEPRSPIPPVGWDGISAITISNPGSYFLTRNLVQVPIVIAADNVTLDLNGFLLHGGGYLNGISATPGAKRNIVIRNGNLRGWQNYAIVLPEATRSTFRDLEISGITGTGLAIGSGNVVSAVRSSNNTQDGINVGTLGDVGGIIEKSTFSANSGDGIALFGDHIDVRSSVLDVNGGCGIGIVGSWNGIADSHIVGNSSKGVCLVGNRNVVVHNQIDGNLGGSVSDAGSGNIVGPISSVGGTDPSQNLGFP